MPDRLEFSATCVPGIIVAACCAIAVLLALPVAASATFPGRNGRIAIAYTFGARCAT